jgi:hypothetical protein
MVRSDFKFVILFALAPTFAQGADVVYNADVVKAECSTEWGDDFSMVKYCMENRKEGQRKFATMVANASEAPIMVEAFARCRSEWGEQWDMVAYCGSQQIKGALSLETHVDGLPPEISSKIIDSCSQQWGVDFSMVAYCTKNQSEAWRSINN